MSKSIHNKKWKEFKSIFGNIIECQDHKDAMQALNGVKAGYSRTKELTPQKERRIKTIEELIKFYK